jgi:hypothetical protein
MLTLSGREPPPVLRVSARTGAGVEQLWQAITTCPPRRPATVAGGRDLLRLAEETLRARFAAAEVADDPGLRQLVAAWQEGHLSGPQAAVALWRLLDAASGRDPHGAGL